MINSFRPGYVSSLACSLSPLLSLFSGEEKLHFHFCCNNALWPKYKKKKKVARVMAERNFRFNLKFNCNSHMWVEIIVLNRTALENGVSQDSAVLRPFPFPFSAYTHALGNIIQSHSFTYHPYTNNPKHISPGRSYP